MCLEENTILRYYNNTREQYKHTIIYTSNNIIPHRGDFSKGKIFVHAKNWIIRVKKCGLCQKELNTGSSTNVRE